MAVPPELDPLVVLYWWTGWEVVCPLWTVVVRSTRTSHYGCTDVMVYRRSKGYYKIMSVVARPGGLPPWTIWYRMDPLAVIAGPFPVDEQHETVARAS